MGQLKIRFSEQIDTPASKLVRNLECFFEKASRSKLIGTPDRIRKVLTVKMPKIDTLDALDDEMTSILNTL